MTVSRRVEITYDAVDGSVADNFEAALRHMAFNSLHSTVVSGVAFSSEPVIPSPEPLVEP